MILVSDLIDYAKFMESELFNLFKIEDVELLPSSLKNILVNISVLAMSIEGYEQAGFDIEIPKTSGRLEDSKIDKIKMNIDSLNTAITSYTDMLRLQNTHTHSIPFSFISPPLQQESIKNILSGLSELISNIGQKIQSKLDVTAIHKNKP